MTAFDFAIPHHVTIAESLNTNEPPSGPVQNSVNSESRTVGALSSGTGNERRTPLNTVLYFSSEDELRDLFAPYFDITTLKTVQVGGKREPHLMNWVFMKK